ncbi:uncharacterized protein EV420DRAFT_1279061 [Desarmillaria tabescens]|uniref:CxC2-like cysteine cluster KDZ transposase-associated domain-containing protein n=1 Tax=Armillaria tabescens TaxID=1929756 RepID=A0AA39JEE9_ARMTA|nr:uncharacterized protein EV420DRAFT_1279061 [Desarmillaria tabescens]KAK0440879.1 hypothetical protein EV420DRAFT_1279061 [Desarmillaria tabescens]
MGLEWECEIFEIVGDEVDEKGNNRTEEVELWKRDPVACVRKLIGDPRFINCICYAPERIYKDSNGTSRVYSKMATADWWWEIQKLLPQGVTIAPIILASDKTQLSRFSGNKQAWPVYLTIGNINKDTRRKPSEHATMLIGYLPVSKLECFSKKQRAIESYQLFHTCMRSLLEPLVKAGKDGVEMLCTDGKTQLVYPLLAVYVADYPEQCLVGCCMENQCPKCTSPAKKMGDPVCSVMRDPESVIQSLKDASAGLKSQEYADWGLRPVNPFWIDLPHCNIFECFTPDILHQLHKGVFKDHLIKWTTSTINVEDGRKPEDEIDGRFKAMTRHPSLRHFKKGISLVTQWTGNEYKNMEKIFLSVIAGSASWEVTVCVRAVLDFIYYAHFEEHTDKSLDKLEEAWRTFHRHKNIFIDLNARNDFNILKVHSTMHYAAMIRSRGTADGFNTEASEQLHIDYAKVAYNASNKKGYIRQMTKWLMRREAVERFQRFLQWAIDNYAEPEEDKEDEDEDEDEDDDDEESSTSKPSSEYGECQYSIAKSPSYTNVDILSLEKQFGTTKFVYALEAFLRWHFGKVPPDFWTSEPATYSVYKHFHIFIPPTPEVSKSITMDSVRATLPQPARGYKKETPAAFDTVLAWKELPEEGVDLHTLGPQGLHVAQVQAIFSLPDRFGTFPHPLAYVEWFTPLRKLNDHTGMFKVSRSTANQQQKSSIIPITYILWSCHLTPCSGRKMDPTWTSENVLDRSKTFFVNSYLRHIDFVLL